MTRSIISKENLAKVIAKNMIVSGTQSKEAAEQFIKWCNQQDFATVAKWATEEDMIETVKDYNEIQPK